MLLARPRSRARRSPFACLALVLAALSVSLPSALPSAAQDVAAIGPTGDAAWTLRASEDGIQVWTQPRPGSQVARVRAEVYVAAPIEDVVRKFENASSFTEWFPNCPESRTLSRSGQREYRYAVTAAPWPVSDRDTVYVFDKHEREPGVVEFAVSTAPDFIPEQADRVRVRAAEGSWRFERTAETETRVRFELHMEPGGSIPEWLINSRLVDSPLRAMQGLRGDVNAARRLGGS